MEQFNFSGHFSLGNIVIFFAPVPPHLHFLFKLFDWFRFIYDFLQKKLFIYLKKLEMSSPFHDSGQWDYLQFHPSCVLHDCDRIYANIETR